MDGRPPDEKRTEGGERSGPSILCIAPIGEEMNRSRRFLTALRRACAGRGAYVELVDPFGTGDSAGEFVDATWDVWVDDLADRARSVAADDAAGPLVLLGIRSGCLLADAVAERLDPPPAHVVEIQPEHDGAAVVRRFLSTRVLAERFSGRRGEGMAGLEAQIAAGKSLELGGYAVGALLLRALGATAIDPDAAPPSTGPSYRFALTEAPPTADDGNGRSGEERSGTENPVEREYAEEGVGEATDRFWRHHRLPTRPFWQLAESLPDPRVVARLAEVLVP